MKKIIYLSCYLILMTGLLTKVVQTVYTSSITVKNNHLVKNLEFNKKLLLEKRSDLTTKFSENSSLLTLSKSQTIDLFSPIKSPIVIDDMMMIALLDEKTN